jgi:hypothetical protein
MNIPVETARALSIAESIVRKARAHGAPTAIIGALAMAVHHHVRPTHDIDVAVYADPKLLYTLKAELIADGMRAEDIQYHACDDSDDLGGVLRIHGDDHDQVDVVNFLNPFHGSSGPAFEAVREANAPIPGYDLVAVKLEHLVALKLQASGRKSALDVEQLLRANPDADMARIREVCARYELADKLDEIVRSM